MEEEDTSTQVTHEAIMDQILSLRDRVVKTETIIHYHDKEFQTVKNSIATLNKTMDRQHMQILDKLEQYNKDALDVLYEQYRENSESQTEIVKQIQINKTTFESYVSKWRAVSWAVWFTITVTLAAVGWGLSTARDLGFFHIDRADGTHISQELPEFQIILPEESNNPDDL